MVKYSKGHFRRLFCKETLMFSKKSCVKDLDRIAKKSFNSKPIVIIIVICLALCAGLFVYLKFAKGINPLSIFFTKRILTSEEGSLSGESFGSEKNVADNRTEENKKSGTDSSDSIVFEETLSETEESTDNNVGKTSSGGNKGNKDVPDANKGGDTEEKKKQKSGTDPTMHEITIPKIPVLTEEPTRDDVAETLYRTVDVGSYKGDLTLAYAQPEIPEEYHVTVKLEIFDENGATIYRYISDAGWLSQPENYDASEKQILQKLGVDSLENRLMILSIKVGDKNLEKYATVYQLIQEYDGSRNFTIAEI